VNNAVKQPQTVLVLGGTSDIGRAIVDALVSPALRQVILAVRDPQRAEHTTCADWSFGDAEISFVEFDAEHVADHATMIADVCDRFGDLDVVIQAFGQLGAEGLNDPVAAAQLAQVNYVGAVSSGLAVAEQLRSQGHGTLVVLSSVAGVRTRASNFVYGSTKAGQDAFATGLGHALVGSGANVLTVRPGFVRSTMTAGMDEAPFAADPSDVGAAVAGAIRRGRSVVWVPGVLQVVFGLLRFAPGFVWRRLDR
jgi:decaprenylphospho-beta-D-erythro-pentofuranosid-2-ulose 2-reductase